MSDLFDTDRQRAEGATVEGTAATYVYTDVHGSPVHRVQRTPTKDFYQEHWNGSVWDRGLGGVEPVLYRLPRVAEAVRLSKTVVVVEGEKDADRLNDLGLVATNNPMGAGGSKWDRVDSSILDGADVAIIPDNDPQGRRHATHVATDLYKRAASVTLVRLSELPPGGDVSDWLDLGHSVDELEAVIRAAKPFEPRRNRTPADPVVSAESVRAYRSADLLEWASQPAEWRIKGALITNTNLVVGGAKKVLKSTLVSAELAFAMANGTEWLTHTDFTVEAPCPVIVVINEGFKSYMRTLSRIADGDITKLHDIYVVEAAASQASDESLADVLSQVVDSAGAQFIILDAWYGFVGAGVEASNLFEMRSVFADVQRIADELDVDVAIVHHLKKGSRGRPDLNDLAFAGVAEWADSWMLLTHRDTPNPATGTYRLGLVAGSRQWGEFEYEIDGELGPVDLEHGGYTAKPQWTVRQVSTSEAAGWSKRSGDSPQAARGRVLQFVDEHPWTHTKSALAGQVPGSERSNRYAIANLLDSGELVLNQKRRQEGTRQVERPVVGPASHTKGTKSDT